MHKILKAIIPEKLKKVVILQRKKLFSAQLSTQQLNTSLEAWNVIAVDQGYNRSLVENQCVDAQGIPVPWYTYPAIEQLSKWDFENKDVLEYGSGNSTLWWSQRARSVTSIESVQSWYEAIKEKMKSNCQLILSPINQELKPQDEIIRYVKVIDKLGKFDIIIIDGEARNHARLHCTERALLHLKDGGLIILDNSDYLPLSCQLLREKGFYQIDFCGLLPLNNVAGTTSIFFKNNYQVCPRVSKHPGPAIGGHVEDWEKEIWLEKYPLH